MLFEKERRIFISFYAKKNTPFAKRVKQRVLMLSPVAVKDMLSVYLLLQRRLALMKMLQINIDNGIKEEENRERVKILGT